jgi:hypothetical protein
MKTLNNSNVNEAKKQVGDLEVYGNGDLFKLLSKASSETEGWMKSTKVMEVGREPEEEPQEASEHGFTTLRAFGGFGCLVQVTTQQRNQDGSYAVAEALTYIPGARFSDFDFPA